MTVPAVTRRARPDEIVAVRAYYAGWGYGAEVNSNEAIFVAVDDDQGIIGVVRLVTEHGTLVLRGMRVSPEFQGQGIGKRLLHLVHQALGSGCCYCYCIPYAHLVRFYGSVGFQLADPAVAPGFLQERLSTYRRRGDGRRYILMRRPASAADAVPNTAL